MSEPTDLITRFTYHEPNDTRAANYSAIWKAGLVFAQALTDQAPDSRELSRALNSVEEAVLLANAAVARNT